MKHPALWEFTAENTPKLVRYISSVLGYVGISLLIWMYVLGSRAIVGLYIKDQAWVLKIHRWLGTYGVLFVFIHPFLSAYVYGENLLIYWLLPQLAEGFQRNVSYGRLAFMVLLIIWVTSALLRGKIGYRPWKYIHYIAYIALPLGLLHIRENGSSAHIPWIRFYYYSYVALYLLITVLRARFVIGFGKIEYEIREHQQLTEGVFLLRLEHPSKRLETIPGQYVYIRRGLMSEEHPFSIVDHNKDTGELSILYKVFGGFTEKLAVMQPGEKVLVDGPYGVFTEEIDLDPSTPVVFIAGGIGITPFIQHIAQRAPLGNTWLFYANQSRNTIVLHDYLKKLLTDQYIDVLSRESTLGGMYDERGYITGDVFTKYLKDPFAYRYFICGPRPMIDTAKQSLEAIGISQDLIYAEEFSF